MGEFVCELDNNQCLVSMSVSTTCVCKKSNLKLGKSSEMNKKGRKTAEKNGRNTQQF